MFSDGVPTVLRIASIKACNRGPFPAYNSQPKTNR